MKTSEVHEAVRKAGKQSSARAYTVIDPRTMGRPVHLLGGFANHLRDDVMDYLRTRINRRYNAGFQIDAVSFTAAAPDDSRRWLTYCADDGSRCGTPKACATDRQRPRCRGIGYRGGDWRA